MTENNITESLLSTPDLKKDESTKKEFKLDVETNDKIV